jgi:flagellar protein FliS
MYDRESKRDRFISGGLLTTSGPKVLVMAFERLDRDLLEAIGAIERRNVEAAHLAFVHAQDIISELRLMLDLNAWEHASAIDAIYLFVWDLLVQANVRKSIAQAQQARRLLSELGSAFAQAAAQPTVATAPEVPATTERRLSLQA